MDRDHNRQTGQQPGATKNGGYRPGLIAEYLDTHQDLLDLYTEMAGITKDGHFHGLPEALNAFKTGLDNHLLSEAVHFYGYMEEQFADQQDKAQLVAAFRHEMRDIARQVTQFIRKWLDAGVTPLSLDEFLDEHQKVGAVLQRRIQVEESDLYPLYRPPR